MWKENNTDSLSLSECGRKTTQRQGLQYESNSKEKDYQTSVNYGKMSLFGDSDDIRFQELMRHFEAYGAYSKQRWKMVLLSNVSVFNFCLSMGLILRYCPCCFLTWKIFWWLEHLENCSSLNLVKVQKLHRCLRSLWSHQDSGHDTHKFFFPTGFSLKSGISD